MDSRRENILQHLWQFNHIGTSLIDKGIDNRSMHTRISLLAFSSRVLVHYIGDVKQLCAAIVTKFTTFRVLFRATTPAALITLMINHLVGVFLRIITQYLRNLIA